MTGGWEERVSRLRAEFDAGFARPLPEPEPPGVPLLLVVAGALPLALRLDELGAVVRVDRLVELPGAAPDVAGLAAVGGRLVVVFDLAVLAGPPGTPRQPGGPRWVATTRAGRDLALGFTHLEGRSSLPPEALSPTVIVEGRARDLVSTTSLLKGTP